MDSFSFTAVYFYLFLYSIYASICFLFSNFIEQYLQYMFNFLYFKYNMCSEIHIKQANRSIHYYQVATFVAPPCKRILSDLAFKKLP